MCHLNFSLNRLSKSRIKENWKSTSSQACAKLHVVYFDQHLGAARTQKLVETFFSAIFQPFLFILKLFQWFHGWNQQKTSENERKKRGFVYSAKPILKLNLPCLHVVRSWYVRLNDWHVLHIPRPLMIAPHNSESKNVILRVRTFCTQFKFQHFEFNSNSNVYLLAQCVCKKICCSFSFNLKFRHKLWCCYELPRWRPK